MTKPECAPWTFVLGACRSVLATGTLLTLLANPLEMLLRPSARSAATSAKGIAAFDFFPLMAGHLVLARWLAIACLALVVLGWRPRWTCLLHSWIASSFMSNSIVADGGDQLAAVLSLLLLPALLTDPRRWHWQAPAQPHTVPQLLRARLALWSVRIARLQIAVVYLHAAAGKFGTREWVNGTAIYYWLLDTRIGVPEAYHPLVLRLLDSAWVTLALSWGPIALELALFTALVMPAHAPARKWLFGCGVLFHSGNIIFFGLVSFFFSMLSALTLLCLPLEWSPNLSGFALPHRRWRYYPPTDSIAAR